MTVSYVGAQGNAGTTVTIPAHQVGDLIIIFAYRDGGNGAPSTPAAGGTVPTWIQIGSGGVNTNASKIAYAIATATNTTSGTWTNATEMICHVYRGATIGASAGTGAGGTTVITYPALTMQRTDNTSWVTGFAGHRTASDVELAPSGMTNRASAGTEAAGHDTNGTVTSWSQQTVTVNTSGAYRSWTVELRDASITLTASAGAYTVTGNAANVVRNIRLVAEKGTFTLAGQDALLRHNAVLGANSRIFTVTGNDLTLKKSYVLTASAGSYSITGQNASIVVGRALSCSAGSFAVTGNNADILHSKVLAANNDSFTVTGNAADIIYAAAKTITANTGSFTVTGNAANIVYFSGKTILGSTGAFTVTGNAAQITKTWVLVASTRAFNVTGNAASIIRVVPGTDKSLYYQTVEIDARKMILSPGSENHLVYYINPYLRIF